MQLLSPFIVFAGGEDPAGVELFQFFHEHILILLQRDFIGNDPEGILRSMVSFFYLSVHFLIIDVPEVGLFLCLSGLEWAVPSGVVQSMGTQLCRLWNAGIGVGVRNQTYIFLRSMWEPFLLRFRAIFYFIADQSIITLAQTFSLLSQALLGLCIFELGIGKRVMILSEQKSIFKKYRYPMIIRPFLIGVLLALAITAPAGDKMQKVPGYPDSFNTSVYTGYLDLKTAERGAHYVFVQSAKGGNNNDPITLWLNGGPGCSSLIGFLQEIGPYYIEQGVSYKQGDNLTENEYSWHRESNLLFIESPAGVGYSYNTNPDYYYNDANTATDNMNAVLDFFQKFPQYKKSPFFIAGESYAGKYIPDLAVLIDRYNLDAANPINLRGIMVGNGVMRFNSISRNQVEYLLDRSFVDPEIKSYWESSCKIDPDSAGCRFFAIRFQQNFEEINPYNVYSYCYYNDSFDAGQGDPGKKRRLATQESILMNITNHLKNNPFGNPKFNGAPCSYFDGMFNYFNLHEYEFKAKFSGQKWNGPCAENITYHIDYEGSMQSYRYLLSRIHQRDYIIHLYNGNWDVVIPYLDTIENIKRLNLVQSYIQYPYHLRSTPFFTNGQHSGFHQLYSGLVLTIVKGASHMVPQSKRAEALNIFNATIEGSRQLFYYLKGQ